MSYGTKGFTSLFSSITFVLVLFLSISTLAENKFIWILGDSHVGGNAGKVQEHSYQQAIKVFLEEQRGRNLSDKWYSIGTKKGIKYMDYATNPNKPEELHIRYTGYPGRQVPAIKNMVSSDWGKLKSNIPGKTDYENSSFTPDVVVIAAGQNDINKGCDGGCTGDELKSRIKDLIAEVGDQSTEKNITIWLVTPMADAGVNCDRKPDDKRDNNRNKRIHAYGLKMKNLKTEVEGNNNVKLLITYNAYTYSGFGMANQIFNWPQKRFGDPHEPINPRNRTYNEEMHPSKDFTKKVGVKLSYYYFEGGLRNKKEQNIYHDNDNCCKDEGGFDKHWNYKFKPCGKCNEVN